MKHLLNDLSDYERKRILEQYENSLLVETRKFNKLMNSKMGDVKPLLHEQIDISTYEGNGTDVTDENRFDTNDGKTAKSYMMKKPLDKNSSIYNQIADFFEEKYNVSVINIMELKGSSIVGSEYEVQFPSSNPNLPFVSLDLNINDITNSPSSIDLKFKSLKNIQK